MQPFGHDVFPKLLRLGVVAIPVRAMQLDHEAHVVFRVVRIGGLVRGHDRRRHVGIRALDAGHGLVVEQPFIQIHTQYQ